VSAVTKVIRLCDERAGSFRPARCLPTRPGKQEVAGILNSEWNATVYEESVATFRFSAGLIIATSAKLNMRT